MDVKDRELRMAAWNVIFVDHFRVPFAGFYQDPNKPRIPFKDALDQLLRSTILTMDNCTGSPHESSASLAWALWPLDGTCSEGVTVESLEALHGNMMKPISPGRYYLVRHCSICCNIKELVKYPMETFSYGHVKRVCIHNLYGSQPDSIDQFRVDPMLRPPRFSPGVSERMIKLNTRQPPELHPVPEHNSVDTGIVVPLSRIADNYPEQSTLLWPSQWPSSARCAISGCRVYWKHGFAPGLGLYRILGQSTVATVTRGPSRIPGDNTTCNPASDKIMMLSHMHNFWKVGLLAIHPGTLRIRCFVPSDVIKSYNDKAARFSDSDVPDRDLLRTHYERCVWVNMTACLPRIALTLSSATDDESTFHEMVEASIKNMQGLGVGNATCQEYCTQKCLLGLKHGDLLDEACPNYTRHNGSRKVKDSSHSLDYQSFTLLIQRQLEIDQSLFCHQPTVFIKGHHAEFFKITLAGFGYTFCAKGVAVCDQHKLMNEYIMYQRMRNLQGACVPVCLGLFALQRPFGSQSISGLEITHMLLMSNAGIPVEAEDLMNQSSHIPSGENLELESDRSIRDIRDVGVDRHDQRKKHLYWNSECERIFYIDFEKDSFISEAEIEDIDCSHSKEIITPVANAMEDQEPDWDGI